MNEHQIDPYTLDEIIDYMSDIKNGFNKPLCNHDLSVLEDIILGRLLTICGEGFFLYTDDPGYLNQVNNKFELIIHHYEFDISISWICGSYELDITYPYTEPSQVELFNRSNIPLKVECTICNEYFIPNNAEVSNICGSCMATINMIHESESVYEIGDIS